MSQQIKKNLENTQLDFQKLDDTHGIEYYAKDGRLTEPSDGKSYRWREMIDFYKKLRRPLISEEAAQFEVKNDEE